MSYAVIKTGGKQYRVEEGQTLLVERLPDDVGATVALQPLLLAGDGDPVFESDGLVKAGVSVAALSISGPTPRVLNADTADLGALLREHAEAVSTKLGFAPA